MNTSINLPEDMKVWMCENKNLSKLLRYFRPPIKTNQIAGQFSYYCSTVQHFPTTY